MVWNTLLASLGQVPWLGMRSWKILDFSLNTTEQQQKTSVLSTFFPYWTQNIAPYQLLGGQLILSQLKPGHSHTGERMWLALSNLGENGISFSRKLGRRVTHAEQGRLLQFLLPQGFSSGTSPDLLNLDMFYEIHKHHEWSNIKTEVRSIYDSITVQPRIAKCSA